MKLVKEKKKTPRVYIPRTSEKDFKVWIIFAISTVLLQLVYTWYVSQHIQLIDRIKWMSKTRECSIRKRRKKALCWRWIGKNDFSSTCYSERLFFVDIHVKLESLFLERVCIVSIRSAPWVIKIDNGVNFKQTSLQTADWVAAKHPDLSYVWKRSDQSRG